VRKRGQAPGVVIVASGSILHQCRQKLEKVVDNEMSERAYSAAYGMGSRMLRLQKLGNLAMHYHILHETGNRCFIDFSNRDYESFHV